MTAEVEKEILELLQELRAEFALVHEGTDECLAIVKDTNAILANRERPK